MNHFNAKPEWQKGTEQSKNDLITKKK